MNKDTLNFIIIFALTFFTMQLAQLYFTKNVVDKVEELQFSEAITAPVDLINQSRTKSFNLDETRLEFDEVSGHLVGLKLNEFWVDLEHTKQISTLFKNPLGEQVILQDLLYVDPESHKIHLIEFKKIDFTFDTTKKILTVTRTHPLVTMLEHYKLNKNQPHSIERQTELLSNKTLSCYLFTELKNTHKSLLEGTQEGARMFQGASFHTSKTKFKKIPFSSFTKKSFSESSDDGGWLSFSQRYFTTALKLDYPGKFYTKFLSQNDTYIAGHLSHEFILTPGKTEQTAQYIYSGPESKDQLASFAPSLELVIDYGFFWPICHLILAVMIFIHSFIHNWGLAIILGTISIRFFVAIITARQAHSMKQMQALQPKIDHLKSIHKDDQVAFSQAMMTMYKNEGVNPFTSFLSALSAPLIQIPIFFAFYSVLMETVALRQAPFIWWLSDLSAKDPFFILPLLVSITAYIQQQLGPKPQDETMALFMQIMPIMLGVFCVSLPAGLSLYWLTGNLFSIAQTWSSNRGQHSPVRA